MPSSTTQKSRRPSNHTRQSSASSSNSTHRPALSRTTSRPKIPVYINVYDLMPSGTLSTILWPLGLSLLHTGIVLLDREYAYGATTLNNPSQPQTGIYHTPPLTLPPGGTHRLTHLQGFTYLSAKEIEQLLRNASTQFIGENYNLLTNNCNHFTSYMCKILTGQVTPSWINRASRIGVVLPCLVPKEWIGVSEAHNTFDMGGMGAKRGGSGANGECGVTGTGDAYASDSDEDEEEVGDEVRARNLSHDRQQLLSEHYYDNPEEERARHTRWKIEEDRRLMKGRDQVVRDADGRVLPASELAPRQSLL
ncbi:hypothetical protein MMC26_005596 [Xylographa opegraphella]|nr:hypothetical protein [Xylographa opegraphella]